MVISGAPESHDSEQICEGAKHLIEVALPKWGSLDASCAWREFAAACADPKLAQQAADFAPDAVLGVDWTSLQPYNHLRQALSALSVHIPPYVFLNYRCGPNERKFTACAQGVHRLLANTMWLLDLRPPFHHRYAWQPVCHSYSLHAC